MWEPRKEQLPPSEPWKIWLIMAGRGFGKTRTGAETVCALIGNNQARHIALIGQTLHESISIMVEGQSGLLACMREPFKFLRSQRKIVFDNGAVAMIFGGDHGESLRGFQFDCVWIDELAKFKKPEELWLQVSMCLRLGSSPKCIITTTPRPIKILHDLIKDKDVFVTRGSTFDNTTNLSALFLARVKAVYENTRIGAQELYGELLDESDGHLWRPSFFIHKPSPGDLARVVVAIDPAVSSHDESCETGIIIAGKDSSGYGYILDDLSGRYSPQSWAGRAIEGFYAFNADRVIAEVNNGGDLVESVLRAQDQKLSFRAIRASRGKLSRAEPIAALYEQKRIFHARYFDALETQMTQYEPGMPSPDRMDALVWALHDLFLNGSSQCQVRVF